MRCRSAVGIVCLLLLVGPIAGTVGSAGAAGSADQAAQPETGLDSTLPALQEETETGPNGANADETDTNQTGTNETAIGDLVDELVEDAMADHDAAGATAAVVEDGEVAHVAGYGEADADAGTPVDAEETSFMVGSVSKLFVWTAVMQGVEDGTLDLDEPVGTYLEEHSFEGDDEVTLEHLGTHAAGYEDRLEGLFVADYEDADDWEAKLEAEMPSQVREPGEAIAYSNHGTALAGLVVQEVYDEPFEQLVEERIFDPLEMDGATFEQPIPDDRATLSQGHVPVGDDEYVVDEPVVVGVPPAGSMSATAPDVAAFAAAMLGEGEYDDEQILDPESVDALLDERATNHPGVDGVGYGFMRAEYAGEEVVWHDGATEYFHTLFALFPEHDVALYVSFNAPTGAYGDVIEGFVAERFDGAEPADREPDPATADRADAYEGEYRTTGFQTTHESLVGLVDAWTVSITDEGYLELGQPIGGDASRWVEVEPGVFEPAEADATQLIPTSLAIEDGTLYLDAPMPPYERLSWYETASVQLGLGAVAILTLFSALFVWPVAAYRSRGWGRMREHLTRPRVAVLGGLCTLVLFVVGLIAATIADPDQLVYGYGLGLRAAFGLLLVFAGVSLAAAGVVAGEWRRVIDARDLDAGSTSRYGLAYLTLLVAALLVLVWQFWYWNLYSAAWF